MQVTQTLTRVEHFSSAHMLRSHPGMCASIHGHNYELTTSVTLAFDNEVRDYWMDLSELKHLIQADVTGVWDHKLLLSSKHGERDALSALITGDNAVSEVVTKVLSLVGLKPNQIVWFYNEPTTENLAAFAAQTIFSSCAAALQKHADVSIIGCKCVLYETPKNAAELTVIWKDDEDAS